MTTAMSTRSSSTAEPRIVEQRLSPAPLFQRKFERSATLMFGPHGAQRDEVYRHVHRLKARGTSQPPSRGSGSQTARRR